MLTRRTIADKLSIEDIHYLPESVEWKEKGTRMKKFVNKLIAMVSAVVLLSTGVTAEAAEETVACGKHGDYYDTLMAVKDVGYYHNVEIEVYVLDENGFFINLSDLTGETYYVKCTATLQERNILVRCGKCHWKMRDYWQTDLHQIILKLR